MRKFNKAYNLAVIFVLIGVFLCLDPAYPLPNPSNLRPALRSNDLSEKTIEKLNGKEPEIKIEGFVEMPPPYNIVIVNARVRDQLYEISGIGVKELSDLDLTSKIVDDPQRCIGIADAVNKYDRRLGEAAKEEKWDWWVPQPDRTFGLKTTDPSEHDPVEKWTYLTHTGICQEINYKKLLYLYEDLSRSREELFCTYKSNKAFPWTWMAAGFILDISDSGEILYAGQTRKYGEQIYPLECDKKELAELKDRLRSEDRIDMGPSGVIKEIDVTNADIRGICVATHIADGWLEDGSEIRGFSLLMAMAVRYDLPIVLIHASVKDMKEHMEFRQEFEGILEKYKNYIAVLFKQVNPGIGDYAVKGAILNQVIPRTAPHKSLTRPSKTIDTGA